MVCKYSMQNRIIPSNLDVGPGCEISSLAQFYERDKIVIAENVRIDDFAVIIGRVVIGDHTHVSPHCQLHGMQRILIGKRCIISGGVQIWSESDDFLLIGGDTIKRAVEIADHCMIGAGTIVLPGADLATGTAIAAGSLVPMNATTKPWHIYAGRPIKEIGKRVKPEVVD